MVPSGTPRTSLLSVPVRTAFMTALSWADIQVSRSQSVNRIPDIAIKFCLSPMIRPASWKCRELPEAFDVRAGPLDAVVLAEVGAPSWGDTCSTIRDHFEMATPTLMDIDALRARSNLGL
jgi:hypothetical protein